MEKLLSRNYIKKGDDIYVIHYKQSKLEPKHTHEFIEIVYIIEGAGRHKIDDELYEVKKGNLLFIRPGQVHSFVPDPTLDYVNIVIEPTFFARRAMNHDCLDKLFSLFVYQDMQGQDQVKCLVEFGGVEMADVEHLVRLMTEEYDKKEPEYDSIICLYVQVLISKTIRWIEGKGKGEKLDLVMEDILRFVNSEYKEKISLADIAQKYFYNPSYFSRLIKNYFGKSFSDLVRDRRIERATELLVPPDLSMEEIATGVGYADCKQFYKVFKQTYNCTPSVYRSKNRPTNK